MPRVTMNASSRQPEKDKSAQRFVAAMLGVSEDARSVLVEGKLGRFFVEAELMVLHFVRAAQLELQYSTRSALTGM